MRNRWIVRACLVLGMTLIFSFAVGAQSRGTLMSQGLADQTVVKVLADELGISVDELLDQLSPMANLKRLAEEKGITLDDLRLAISHATKERLQERLQERPRDRVRHHRQPLLQRHHGMHPGYTPFPGAMSVRRSPRIGQPIHGFGYTGGVMWQPGVAMSPQFIAVSPRGVAVSPQYIAAAPQGIAVSPKVYVRRMDGQALQRPFVMGFGTAHGQPLRPHASSGPIQSYTPSPGLQRGVPALPGASVRIRALEASEALKAQDAAPDAPEEIPTDE